MKEKLRSKQLGFSVIELMIATLLGVFVIGGIISVFISSTNNYRLQSALSQVQEKGRFALRKMRIDIQQAGYNIDPEEDQVAIEWSAVGNVADLGANAVNVLSIYKRGVLIGGEYIRDDGVQSDSIHRVSYYMRINGNTLFRNAVVDIGAPNPVAGEETVITGVARLVYQYGADLTSTGGALSNESTRSIDWIPLGGALGSASYISAGQLTGLAEFAADTKKAWGKVRSVQVELVVASDEGNVVQTPDFGDV
jgi:hypothetical protein